jgi:hypothetical protein
MVISDGGFWAELSRNRVLWTSILAWATAQGLKVVLGVVRERRFNFKWFVGSGGMPSSHAAFVNAATVSVGLTSGFDSYVFGAVAVFAFVIMFDAQGVRRQSGKQAEALNKILDDLYSMRGVKLEPLMELFGHTPIEVFTGAFIGAAVALAVL